MLLLATIIGVILIGLVLIIIEIVVIPGTTVVGIVGTMMMIGGVYWMYADYGMTAGNIALVVTFVSSIGAIYFALKSKAWKRFSLNSSLQGRANLIDNEKIVVGGEGVTLSKLRPMGSILVNGMKVEAQSEGEAIEENKNIIILKIIANKIIVKIKN